jgi:hypothetical protein
MVPKLERHFLTDCVIEQIEQSSGAWNWPRSRKIMAATKSSPQLSDIQSLSRHQKQSPTMMVYDEEGSIQDTTLIRRHNGGAGTDDGKGA